MSSSISTDAAASASSSLFERHDTLGSGGIGTVYRGVQKRLKRDVAIKEIKDIFHVFADVQRDDIVGRFMEIIQTQARLNHTNIIETLDVVTDEAYPYVVTQWAPNGNLRRLIETTGRPPLKVALRYFLQILHALNTAHEADVVHGGLKPENVVLDLAGNALVTDFGISRVVERTGGNQVYVGVGTVAYMSPEQFQDPNDISAKSDIYSLGIMFYEMLTGKVPGRRSPMPSSFYPDIPRKLDDIFDRMSMDSAEDRYSDIDSILKDIYDSAEVMKILDKRGGVLFLRDPMTHGEEGGVGEAGQGEADYSAEFSSSSAPIEPLESGDLNTMGALSNDATGFGEFSQEQVEGLKDASLATSSDADEVSGDDGEPVEDGDVLGKLDKYGAMFDDD